jgi:hypothetical protein
MRHRFYAISILVTFTLLMTTPCLAEAGQFLAYSMKEAERHLKEGRRASTEVTEMGGITRLAGMVYDPQQRDLIIVGQVNAGEEQIYLDDFVVALRTLLVHNTWPLVSIDKTPDSYQTGKQRIRFEGGIADTRFGKELLEADIVLKKLALGLLPAEVWGLRSYFTLCKDYAQTQGMEERLSTRFWFYPPKDGNILARREDVFALERVQVGVQTQVMSLNGTSTVDSAQVRDPLGEEFASALTTHYEDLSVYYPQIRRLKIFFDLVALARGVQTLSTKPDLTYWLQEYNVPRVETPMDYPLLQQKAQVHATDTVRILQIDGGIELRALVLRLQDGDVTALKEAVLHTRPTANTLTWKLPLAGWQIPGAPKNDLVPEVPADQGSQHSKRNDQMGAYVTRQISRIGTESFGTPSSFSAVVPSFPRVGLPKFEFANQLPAQRYAQRVGGVMLSGTAHLAGASTASVDLSDGRFSLVVEGENARLSPESFRKFLTAMWAVYYSKQDPGISIDPIAPNIDKHLVRYIGKVINTDLGRVMREADYLMKKWVVGTERPAIFGFADVDDLTARHGLRYLGASRRVWLVPEDLRFTQGGELLLFDSGRMTVKTEYVLQNKGVKAEPADEAFAKFFTAHYQEIAARYPVYTELFEYAKLVSLAKYLKENRVPLYWFLLAHKDLVLTEDSPGTVDALAKGSDHFAGVEIRGGVDLGVQGNYVFDQAAVHAVRRVLSQLPTQPPTTSGSVKGLSKPSVEPFSFDLKEQRYSVVPQHSLTSGKDQRGIRYQTDVALWREGQPGLELVRYYDPQRKDEGEFGQGWRLLVPYHIKPVGSARRKFLNARIPQQMAVENLLTGQQEVLAFSTDRYSIAGYVPEKIASSQVVGLFLMSDASYRLVDKLGNEFWFDQAGYLTDMIFSKDHHVRFQYLDRMTAAVEQPLYEVRPVDEERITFLNVRIPKRMQVTDLVHGGSEVLVFSEKGKIAGYVPKAGATSRFAMLAILSDASFRLLDRAGNEVAFDGAGDFTGLAVASQRRMVQFVSVGKQQVSFDYTIDQSGTVRIAKAQLTDKTNGTHPTVMVRYQYDAEGRLARVVKGSDLQLAKVQH